MKSHLIFDVTDANTILDSDSVGAFVRSSDGTLIDHLTVAHMAAQFVGQVVGMTTDVTIDALVRGSAGNITLTGDGVKDVDDLISDWNTANPDNEVVLSAGDGSQIPGNDEEIILSGGSDLERLVVDATMRDAHGNAITSTNGAMDVNLKTPVVIDVDLDGIYDAVTNPTPDSAGAVYHTRAASITIAEQVERTSAGGVAAIDVGDIAKLNAIDSNAFLYAVNDDDGDLELLSLSNASGGLNVHIAGGTVAIADVALANTAIKSTANALGAAETRESVVGSALASRKYLFIANVGNRAAYIGGADLSSANGFPLSPGAYVSIRAGDAVDVQWISANTSQEIRTLELS